jgi:hypothetical protein
MADRYWVGGTGTWDATSTTNWSASSGGGTGASVPTAADNVFFDANSNVGTTAFTVTMATTPRVCNDFTASGLDGVMTLAGTSIGLTVSGSLTFQATNFSRTYTGTTTFNATSTGKTVTTNGVAFGAAVTFDGVGGGWTLGSALTATNQTITVTNGTFDTSSSGNYAITASTISSTNSNVRTINFNASTVSVNILINFTTSTNLTFNAGTSTINLLNVNPALNGGGKTFYNVAFTSAALTNSAITGENAFNNLSIASQTTVGIGQLSISANQTINGTLTVSAGTAAAYRIMVRSDTIGTTRTLTCAAVSLTDVDFRDITIAGAASPASGTRLGDAKGNSGITFPAAKTVYYRQTGSASWGATGSGSWSATSGGALDATQFPLAQDTAVFPAATYPASGSTININASYNIGTIDMSLRTSNTMTLGILSNAPIIYGNWICGTGITNTSNVSGSYTFAGRTTQQITSAGRSFAQAITINSPSGSVTLQDAMTTPTAITGATTLTQGTLDLQSYTLSTGNFSSTNSNTRTIAFGTGNITCTGTGTVWNTATTTGLTTTGTQVVNVTSTGSTAITVSVGTNFSEANAISFNFTGGTYPLTWGGSSIAVRNLNFTGYAGTVNEILILTIYGNLTLSAGMSLTASFFGWNFRKTSGTQTITSNAKTMDFPITINGSSSTTVTCADALTLGSTQALTFSLGTLKLAAGTTSTVGSFVTPGTTLKYLQSTTPGTQATISDASGTNTVTYLSIQDSAATGGATWDATAATNVNAGNNSGWTFGAAPTATGNFLIFF